jgi:hypothetical protein
MKPTKKKSLPKQPNYQSLVGSIAQILEQGKKLSYQTMNAVLTSCYWQVGRQIVEFEEVL